MKRLVTNWRAHGWSVERWIKLNTAKVIVKTNYALLAKTRKNVDDSVAFRLHGITNEIDLYVNV